MGEVPCGDNKRQTNASFKGWPDKWWPEKITVIPLPASQLTRVGSIVAAISTYTTMRQEAQRFLDFVTSADGQAIFSRNGFQTTEPRF